MLQLNNLQLATYSSPVQLQFLPGQISVVLGRNNSGKTNLLRLIAGLSTSASGEVLLDEQPLPALNSRSRPVAYVFQAFVNYPHWSVRSNIESPLLGRGAPNKVSRAERRNRVSEIAETLQLGDLLDRRPAELSGGQQQRLAIGRALASEARVLLLDEPFVNLDFRLREKLTEDLGELLRSTGTTVLFASSDCRDAFSLADSLVLVAEQQILQCASPLDAYRHPVSIEAAHLMSEPAANIRPHPADSAKVQLIRPEHLKLSRDDLGGVAKEALCFRLKVEAIETNGSHTYVQGALLDGQSHSAAAVSNAATTTNDQPRWVARLDGIRDLESLRPVGAHATPEVTEFFVDPRNLLEMVKHGSA